MTYKQCRSAAWGRKFLMLCAVMLSTSLAFAGSPKMSKDLEGKNASDQVDVIVQFKQAPTARHHQKVLSRGGTLNRKLGLVKAGAYTVPASALADLAADPDVAYIAPDRPVKGMLDMTAAAVNASAAWSSGYTGAGIGVAVIDSGIAQHSLFEDANYNQRVVYKQDFTGDTNVMNIYDPYGHGTHVAGIIGAGSPALPWATLGAAISRASRRGSHSSICAFSIPPGPGTTAP